MGIICPPWDWFNSSAKIRHPQGLHPWNYVFAVNACYNDNIRLGFVLFLYQRLLLFPQTMQWNYFYITIMILAVVMSEAGIRWLTPSLAQRQLWPNTHFGPEILRPRILWPGILWPGNTSARNNFGPENTSARLYTLARKQLWPKKYFGPLIYFGPEILRPDRLRPATLWPGDQTFKSVIFHHFWPSISLGGALGWN